jgi:hypothetical protein
MPPWRGSCATVASTPTIGRWYVGEQDLRGHDPEVGWVQTVAHGADFFGACGAAGVGGPGALLEALARRLMAPTGDVRSELAPLTKRFTALGTPVSATWMSGTLGGSDTVILVALGQSPPVRGIPSRRAATHHLHPHGPASVRGIPSRRQAT